MFTKTKDTEQAPSGNPTQDAIKGAANKPTARSAASIICGDMEIHGSITSEGALQIDGLVDGDVSASDITIGAGGKVVGEVKAEAVKVKGEVQGSIRARKVELETGAKVHGDILHSSLSIQPNAMFEGQVKHDHDPLKDSAPKPANSDRATTASSSKPAETPAASTTSSSTSSSNPAAPSGSSPSSVRNYTTGSSAIS
ncbi:bactofilin family protein [Henriciella aquimarina]|uniref:bactofilin family protein n=1 Tax=Henriciella aquimarina TaxID=545261 RepID=UPI0009FF1457|nr:polymer-forming cytoskeletal protein [Henriciella aquimarina]